MRHGKQRLDNLVVVDANSDDYADLLQEICRYELEVRMFATGEEALQAAGARDSALWIINMRLPDMSGISLLKLVRQRLTRCRVVITSDVYSSEDELSARCAGATAYVCKPPSVAWLDAHQLQCRYAATRTPAQNESASRAALRPP